MYKLQLSITDKEQELLAARAARLGYDVTKYVKFLLSQEAYQAVEEIPTYKMDSKLVSQVSGAWDEYKAGKTKKVNKLADLYEN